MVTASNKFNINRLRVLRDIGYGPGSEPSSRMQSLVSDYIDNVHNFIAPMSYYIIKKVKRVRGNTVFLADGIVFKSGVIARLVERANEVALFVLTIGNYLEDLTAKLAGDGLVLQAAVLDAIGSDAAERLADSVEARIAEIAVNQKLVISRRFSPGYCDWDVSDQNMLFKALDGNHEGITLNDGCLMIPRKSISGLIAIGPDEVKDYNPCVTCDKYDCVGRR